MNSPRMDDWSFSLFALCIRRGRARNDEPMPVNWKKYFESDSEILRGKPRLRGTRLPVGGVLGYLAAGKRAEDIIAEFPDLTRGHIASLQDTASPAS